MILPFLIASFALDFKEKQSVDLNQAFYVCRPGVRNIMPRIAIIESDPKRRSIAAAMGCPFRMTNMSGPTYHVVKVQGNLCLKPRNEVCEVEGHELLVERAGKTLTVIQLSSDISFD